MSKKRVTVVQSEPPEAAKLANPAAASDVVAAIQEAEALAMARQAEEERTEPSVVRRLFKMLGVPVSRS